jgi:hypothetical protein
MPMHASLQARARWAINIARSPGVAVWAADTAQLLGEDTLISPAVMRAPGLAARCTPRHPACSGLQVCVFCGVSLAVPTAKRGEIRETRGQE